MHTYRHADPALFMGRQDRPAPSIPAKLPRSQFHALQGIAVAQGSAGARVGIARAHQVAASQLHRVQLQLPGDPVQVHLPGQYQLGRAVAAHRPGHRGVGQDRVALAAHARYPVLLESLIDHGAQHVQGTGRICPRIGDHLDVLGLDEAVPVHAGLDLHHGGMPGPGSEEYFPAVQFDFHRSSAHHGQGRRHRLDGHLQLAAESSPNRGLDHPYLVHGEGEDPGQQHPEGEDVLGGAPDGQRAITADIGDAGMRLQGDMAGTRGVVLVREHIVAPGQPLVEVAGFRPDLRHQVAAGLNLGRILSQSLFRIEHRRQDFIIDIQQ